MKYNYKPSLGELGASLQGRTREFLLENTLHGFPYFVDPKRPKFERVIWFLITMASIGATFAIIITLWGKFQTDPILTGLETGSQTAHVKIDFPQILICYDWENLNHSAIRKSELPAYKQIYEWQMNKNLNVPESFQKMNNLREIFKIMAPNCNTLFTDCAYRGKNESCSELFTSTIIPVGACCKVNTSTPLSIDDPKWGLSFLTSYYPWKLYIISKSDSSPSRNERHLITFHGPLNINFRVAITFSSQNIRHFTRRQRQCHYPHEGSSITECHRKHHVDQIYEKCKCLPWYLQYEGYRECSIAEYHCLENLQHKSDLAHVKCTLYCNHTSYIVTNTKPAMPQVLHSHIELLEWPTGLYMRETRFGYLDLLVSFGGIASLFLGYSLLTSVELGYYFTLRAYCGAVIESSRKKHNITKVQVIEAKPPRKVDVNPLYYQYVE